MRFKSILYSMVALTMATSFASCSNEEAVKMPEQPGVNLANSETVSLLINMPSEMRTRAGEEPTMTYGDDGLYSFSRKIDKLWYAVYNKGTLLYNSFQAGIPQGQYNPDDETFSLDIQIPLVNNQIKLEDYSVFFFAGNALDKVQQTETANGIGLDFANKTLYAYPSFLNKSVASGDYFNPVQYDFFAKYTTLDKIVDADMNGHVTLIRPFCQVSLLTDELCQAAVLSTYDSNGKVAVKTSPTMRTKTGASTSETMPYAWDYGTDNLLTKDVTEIPLTLDARAFNNAEKTLSIPQEVTFKNRKMFCTGSYLMLATESRKAYSDGATSQKFKFNLTATGDRYSTEASVSAMIPQGGLKANEKYIMYNRKYNPETGETGDPDDPDDKDPDPDPDPDPNKPGGGIFSSHYLIDIVVDPTWDNNNNIVY